MTVLIVVLMFALFVAADFLVRAVRARIELRRTQREREAALETAVRLEWTAEARSLKRVEVPQPKARILAVDDEPVVLDAFRKILVLDGFSVDTVESGAEALGLVQRHDYDFVFTDLKMPGMGGVEVVKGVKQLRPDVDVVVITGYATIESAVETMRDGAVEYVQKPFTVDELTKFVRRLVTKREMRLEAQRLPHVRVVGPGLAPATAEHEFTIPGGAFLSDGHMWARIEPSGRVRLGLDDFAHKALGAIERVDLPAPSAAVRQAQPLFAVHRGTTRIGFPAQLSGRIVEVNDLLLGNGGLRADDPYDGGWVCVLEPSDLTGELAALRIGKTAVEWYQSQIVRLRDFGGPAEHGTPQVDWGTLDREFFAPATEAAA
jgi:CheY-like chemotaxis protein/glycine cleavage system H lipoate-binding protein